MIACSIEKRIAAPAADVFAKLTDLASASETISAIRRIEILTDGPVTVGTRFRETRVMFGREATEEMEISALDPPRRFALRAESCGCRFQSEFRLEPAGGGTRVVMVIESEPLTFVARVLSVLMRPMMKPMAKACAKDLDDLAAAVEKG